MSRKEIERQNKHWICKSIHPAIYVQVLSSRSVRPSMYIPGRQYATLATLGSTRPPLALGLHKAVFHPLPCKIIFIYFSINIYCTLPCTSLILSLLWACISPTLLVVYWYGLSFRPYHLLVVDLLCPLLFCSCMRSSLIRLSRTMAFDGSDFNASL